MAAITSSRTARAAWARLSLLAGLLVSAFALAMGTGAGADVSNVGLCLGAITAAVACLVRARSFTGRARWGWALIGSGAFSWGLGQSTRIFLDTVPLPSVADVGYLGMYVFTPIGLLILPSVSQALAHRVRSVLDGLMMATSLAMVSWIFVIAPLIAAERKASAALAVSLAYPLGDIVIVTMVIYMLAQQWRSGQLALVGAGIVAIAISDIGFAYLHLVGDYSAGGVADIGWFAGFALILLAATKPCTPAPATSCASARPFGILLPYAVVLTSVVISVVWYFRTGQGDLLVAYLRSALTLLIIARQLLTLRENGNLTRTLEQRVDDRTAELFASEQRFHALVQQSSDVVTVVSPSSEVLYQSESVQRVFGWPAGALTGRRLITLMDLSSGLRMARALRAVARTPYETAVLELPVRHRDGRLRHAEITITNLLSDPSVGGLVLNTRDISERKQLQDQLVHEAYHDALTQLANRALFRERVSEALRDRSATDEVTVLFLDLDGFKEVNDSLGHLAGDQLLVQVGERLRASVRDEDVVARFGGDEFAVLVKSPVGGDEAVRVAERIIAMLDEPFASVGGKIHVQASIGLAAAGLLARVSSAGAALSGAVVPGAASAGAASGAASSGAASAGAAEQLMRNADLAMYKAKSAGGSGYAAYDPGMLAGLVARIELEADLRAAVERGQLRLHYQPTIDLSTDEVVGFEALVRWQHPVRGMIPPSEFIPLAEATGLIVPLGRWVLQEACRQAVAWGGRPLKMAVNVSVRQFDRGDLAEVVADILAETGMPADRLCLEMTESVLMTDTDDNLTQLTRLKALGVTLAIDDFGTGYSSLAYLRRFPVDTLKIDRSFVDRLGGSSTDDAALADTIVQLGKSLGMATVAEGIEDHGQLAALRAMGCDYAQGYYFSRPLPADEATSLLPLSV